MLNAPSVEVYFSQGIFLGLHDDKMKMPKQIKNSLRMIRI